MPGRSRRVAVAAAIEPIPNPGPTGRGRRIADPRGSVVDQSPTFGLDGSILFGRQAGVEFHVWRLGNKGEPSRLLGTEAKTPVVSRGGPQVVCKILNPKTAIWEVAVVSLSDPNDVRTYPRIPVDATIVRWSPDDTALAYVKDGLGVSNIWKTSISTGLEEQVTHFKEDKIFSFDWSPITHDLALVRGIAASDAVLFRRAP